MVAGRQKVAQTVVAGVLHRKWRDSRDRGRGKEPVEKSCARTVNYVLESAPVQNAGWMRNILDAPEDNAFSAFVHAETNRVLRDRVKNVLAVPGVRS